MNQKIKNALTVENIQMNKDTIINLDPEHLTDADEKMQHSYVMFKTLSGAIDNFIIENDENKQKEMDFVIGLVMNMMINRPYCLNCFMTRFMEVIDKIEQENTFFNHSSEEEKQKMN